VLVADPAEPYLCAMKVLLLAVLAALTLTNVADAQTRPTHPGRAGNAPHLVGKFDDWQAATHQEAGQTVCYAFTRASSSAPAVPGRGDVVLTITHRPGARDGVAVSTGYAFPVTAEMQMAVDGTVLPFYTSNRSAFARDGRATTVAFGRARQAVSRAPGPRATMVTDTFPLRGFAQAYAAINRACPVR